jgi:serine/threonine protein kinase
MPADAPEGLCPQCLLKVALEPQSQAPASTASPGKSSAFTPPTPQELNQHFPQLEFLELLGKGGMGAVYKARQKSLDRMVAVKILPPDVGLDPAFAERFTREARALAKLNHPHIVGIHDFGSVQLPGVRGPSTTS